MTVCECDQRKVESKHSFILLTVVFFLSGFSNLIYQVCWQRVLTLYYGVGSISITLVVSIFMFGLGIGALLGGFLAERFKNRILLFFVIESLIGCFGLVSIPFLNFLGRSTAGCSYILTLFYMAVFLCVPTVLMGAALPLLVKIINKFSRSFLRTISLLYFVNTLGAAVGALLAGYFIISFLGLDGAVYFAAIIHFISAALIILRIRLYFKNYKVDRSAFNVEVETKTIERWVYAIIFITGFLNMGYEIIWLRIIKLLVKASPYAFSSVLSIYLLGIALGSFCMSKYSLKKNISDKKNLFFLLQFLAGVYTLAVFIGYFYLTEYTPFKILTKISFATVPHPINYIPMGYSFFSLKDISAYLFQLIDVFFWPVLFILIPTIFMGAAFPLIASLADFEPHKEGKTVSLVYFLNTAGGTIGAALTGFLILPRLGTEMTLFSFTTVGILFGVFIVRIGNKKITFAKKIIPVFLLLALDLLFFPKKGQLSMLIHAQQIYSDVGLPQGGRFEYIGQRTDGIWETSPEKSGLYKIISAQKMHDLIHSPNNGWVRTYIEENIDGIIVAFQFGEEIISYINGSRNMMRPTADFLARVIETLTFSPKVESVLIIGCGTFIEPMLGVTEVQKITVVEVNDAVVKNLKKIDFFKTLLGNKKVELIIDDGRRFLQRENKKYDVIIMATVRSTDSYANNLNSQEFFSMIQKRLNPGGAFMFWIQEDRILPKTILSVFKHLRFYKTACMASDGVFIQDFKKREKFLSKYSTQQQAAILTEYSRGLEYLGNEEYVNGVTGPYPINKDWKPNLEYYLGYKIRKKSL